MVDGINNIGKVNNITTSNIDPAKQKGVKLGSFGYGYNNSADTGISVERNIPGLAALEAQFKNVEVPAYHKNIAQLTISDADYIPDGVFQEREFCEV